MESEFNGKVALVTGAGSGIGRATALLYAQHGAQVVASDIDADAAADTAEEISRGGGTAASIACDVAKSDEVQQLIDATVARFGRLDFACNNAGIGGPSMPTGEYPDEGWLEVIGVNLIGVYYCMRYEIPQMLKAGGGAIVNMASILGTVGFANASAYVAAKHGVLGLTKTAAIEYSAQNIHINAVCPGFIYTPLLEHAGITKGSEIYDTIRSLHPAGRLGTSEEVAEAVIWLSSSRSSFVDGHSLLVDGGYVAR